MKILIIIYFGSIFQYESSLVGKYSLTNHICDIVPYYGNQHIISESTMQFGKKDRKPKFVKFDHRVKMPSANKLMVKDPDLNFEIISLINVLVNRSYKKLVELT